MSEQSSIEWTAATWNPVRGYTKVSPGCKRCYAETFLEDLGALDLDGISVGSPQAARAAVPLGHYRPGR